MKEQILKNYLIMASIVLIISSCFALTSTNSDTVTTANSKNIFEADEIIQWASNINQTQINVELPFREIYQIYKSKCSQDSIDKADEQINSLKTIRNNSQAWNRALDLSNRFISVQKYLSSVKQEDEDYFCTQKYMLYHMLEETQKLYVSTTNTKLIRHTTIKDSSKSNSVKEVKTDTHSSAIYPKYIILDHKTQSLTKEELDYADLADEYIQREIWNLLKQNFLQEEDLKTLDGKITINYNKTCKNTKWSFHILQNSDWTVKQFKWIILNINLCENKNFVQNYTNYIRQIFIHEISHYIYMFRDSQISKFDTICWDAKSSCSAENFVSNYAQNNAAEDYAESFAYRYLDNFNGTDKQHWAPSDAILGEKLSYFDNLARRLQD